ncbi:MAG TPA: hypothetical protein VNA15_06865 [Candidatus Angelobacter sp.]|nr:hypothetical protein [Candidatus Angelobacter sp.]
MLYLLRLSVASEKNTMFFNTRRLIIANTLIVLFLATSVTTVRAEGSLLRGFDVPATTPEDSGNRSVAPSLYWPIGIAFDGTNLYYSQPCLCTRDIFHTTTNGVLLNTLHELSQAGALAWDGTNLWVGIFSSTTCASNTSGCSLIFEVNPSTGNIIKTVDVSAIFAADGLGGCNVIDGLSFDTATGTLWVSPDIGCAIPITNNPCGIGFVYNVDQSGNLIKRLQLPFGVAGDAKVGNYLYLVTCGSSATNGQRVVNKTTLDGTLVSSFVTVSVSGFKESHGEGIAFDPTSFAPNCAVWVVQSYNIPFDASLAAYQIDCP